jgi:lysophospholipase L1-like esterase
MRHLTRKTYGKPVIILIILMIAGVSAPAQDQGPDRWEDTIKKFEQQDQENPPASGAILFVGSSSIAMWKDLADYFPGHRVLNRGFGGSDFTDLIYYAERVIFPYKPSMIVVYEGDNDIAKGESPDKVLENAKTLRNLIRRAAGKTPVVFISPKPSIARWDLRTKYEEVNDKLKKYASDEPDTEFADVWSASLGSDGKVLNNIFLEDNLHMNAAGYKIWQNVLLPYLPKN